MTWTEAGRIPIAVRFHLLKELNHARQECFGFASIMPSGSKLLDPFALVGDPLCGPGNVLIRQIKVGRRVYPDILWRPDADLRGAEAR
jgi:hypothetical protein